MTDSVDLISSFLAKVYVLLVIMNG
jgi:hypothetical protein